MFDFWHLFGGDRKGTGQCGCTASKGHCELGPKEGESFCRLSRKPVVGRLSRLRGVGVIRLCFSDSALLWLLS